VQQFFDLKLQPSDQIRQKRDCTEQHRQQHAADADRDELRVRNGLAGAQPVTNTAIPIPIDTTNATADSDPKNFNGL